jgi:formylglycine-generating enzyme
LAGSASSSKPAVPPAAGSGAHALIANSGWDSAWNPKLAANKAALMTALKCAAQHQTWSDTTGTSESLPINCITWYEAMAFCIWDGGYLPTLAESEFASAGGNESRSYPWSPSSNPASLTLDCSYANYQLDPANMLHCVNGQVGGTNRVGSESPKGDGKWGHTDLAGNVDEWVLDWNVFPPPVPCVDCANLTPGTSRSQNGGNFKGSEGNLRVSSYSGAAPDNRLFGFVGVRCARKL